MLLRTVGQIWVFLCVCFLRWWTTLRHVHIQGRNTTKKSDLYFIYILSLSNWDYESVSSNRKLNLITWWICFSFKRVDGRRATIHVFTETPPTQRSRKVVQSMHNEQRLLFVQSSTCECKYFLINIVKNECKSTSWSLLILVLQTADEKGLIYLYISKCLSGMSFLWRWQRFSFWCFLW